MTWANASVDAMRCHHAENLPCEEAIPEHLLYPPLELASEWARMQLPNVLIVWLTILILLSNLLTKGQMGSYEN